MVKQVSYCYIQNQNCSKEMGINQSLQQNQNIDTVLSNYRTEFWPNLIDKKTRKPYTVHHVACGSQIEKQLVFQNIKQYNENTCQAITKFRQSFTSQQNQYCSQKVNYFLIFNGHQKNTVRHQYQRRVAMEQTFTQKEIGMIIESIMCGLREYHLKFQRAYDNFSLDDVIIEQETNRIYLKDPWLSNSKSKFPFRSNTSQSTKKSQFLNQNPGNISVPMILSQSNNQNGFSTIQMKQSLISNSYSSPQKLSAKYQNRFQLYDQLQSDLFITGMYALQIYCMEPMNQIYQKNSINFTMLNNYLGRVKPERLRNGIQILLSPNPSLRSNLFQQWSIRCPIVRKLGSQFDGHVQSHLTFNVNAVTATQTAKNSIVNLTKCEIQAPILCSTLSAKKIINNVETPTMVSSKSNALYSSIQNRQKDFFRHNIGKTQTTIQKPIFNDKFGYLRIQQINQSQQPDAFRRKPFNKKLYYPPVPKSLSQSKTLNPIIITDQLVLQKRGNIPNLIIHPKTAKRHQNVNQSLQFLNTSTSRAFNKNANRFGIESPFKESSKNITFNNNSSSKLLFRTNKEQNSIQKQSNSRQKQSFKPYLTNKPKFFNDGSLDSKNNKRQYFPTTAIDKNNKPLFSHKIQFSPFCNTKSYNQPQKQIFSPLDLKTPRAQLYSESQQNKGRQKMFNKNLLQTPKQFNANDYNNINIISAVPLSRSIDQSAYQKTRAPNLQGIKQTSFKFNASNQSNNTLQHNQVKKIDQSHSNPMYYESYYIQNNSLGQRSSINQQKNPADQIMQNQQDYSTTGLIKQYQNSMYSHNKRNIQPTTDKQFEQNRLKSKSKDIMVVNRLSTERQNNAKLNSKITYQKKNDAPIFYELQKMHQQLLQMEQSRKKSKASITSKCNGQSSDQFSSNLQKATETPLIIFYEKNSQSSYAQVQNKNKSQKFSFAEFNSQVSSVKDQNSIGSDDKRIQKNQEQSFNNKSLSQQRSSESKLSNNINLHDYMTMSDSIENIKETCKNTIVQVNDESTPQMSEKQQSEHDQLGQQYVVEEYETGSKYEGNKKNGMRHGQGKFFYQDGGHYEGQWRENKMHGWGKLFYEGGRLAYQGNWKQDQFHGFGKVYNDNPVPLNGPFDYTNFDLLDDYWIYYEGSLVSDTKQGRGKIKLTNGQSFQGDFHVDRIQGFGKYKTKDGSIIEGIWRDSRLMKIINNI